MTQRQITQPLATVPAASSSSSALFIGPRPRARSGLIHIPPRPLAQRFPEALPRWRDTLVIAVLGIAIAVTWFVTTPSATPAPVVSTGR